MGGMTADRVQQVAQPAVAPILSYSLQTGTGKKGRDVSLTLDAVAWRDSRIADSFSGKFLLLAEPIMLSAPTQASTHVFEFPSLNPLAAFLSQSRAEYNPDTSLLRSSPVVKTTESNWTRNL